MNLTITPTLKQHKVYEALRNPLVDDIFFGGGAGGGKSWTICESRLINALRFPSYRSFIARKELKRLMQSTYITWVKVCSHHKIPHDSWKLNGQYNYIEFNNGSRIDLLDVDYLPSDPLYERLGSTEYTDGALEEAGEIHHLAYDVLKTRIGRHKNQEFGLHATLLISGNPKKNWTHTEFYKPSKNNTLPSNKVFIQALFADNPYTAEEYGKQLAQITDKATKERLMYGNWDYDEDPAKLMEWDAITDIFTNNVVADNQKYLVCDVARLGNDKTTISIWDGLLAPELHEYEKQTTDKTIQVIRDFEKNKLIPRSHILIDEDGIGGGVVDGLPGSKGFTANSSPIENALGDRENYGTLKDQCGFRLAQMVNERKIGVRTDSIVIKDRISEELSVIKRKDADKDSKVKINPKDEVKELIGRSPDWSDNLLMRMWFEITPKILTNTSSTFIPHFTHPSIINKPKTLMG